MKSFSLNYYGQYVEFMNNVYFGIFRDIEDNCSKFNIKKCRRSIRKRGIALYFYYKDYRCSLDLMTVKSEKSPWFRFHIDIELSSIDSNQETIITNNLGYNKDGGYYFQNMPKINENEIPYNKVYDYLKSKLDELP